MEIRKEMPWVVYESSEGIQLLSLHINTGWIVEMLGREGVSEEFFKQALKYLKRLYGNRDLEELKVEEDHGFEDAEELKRKLEDRDIEFMYFHEEEDVEWKTGKRKVERFSGRESVVIQIERWKMEMLEGKRYWAFPFTKEGGFLIGS